MKSNNRLLIKTPARALTAASVNERFAPSMLVSTEFGVLHVEDLGGLVLPGAPTCTIEHLRVAHVLRRRPALRALWQSAAATQSHLRTLLGRLSRTLDALSFEATVQALNPGLMAHYLSRDRSTTEDCLAATRGTVACLVGAPAFDAAWGPPGDLYDLLGPGPHYLPTMHRQVQISPSGVHPLTDGLWAGGLPVLNTVAGFHTRDPNEPWPCDAARATLAQGLNLLRMAWPQAEACARRWYSAAMLLYYPGGGRYLSFTSQDLPGAYIATAHNPAQVCDSMVHELSHARLAAAQAIDPLIQDDGEHIHPSPWRPDPRPLMGIVAGVHAFLNVHHFYAGLRRLGPQGELLTLADHKLKAGAQKVRQAWKYARPRVRTTTLGAHFINEMHAHLERLP